MIRSCDNGHEKIEFESWSCPLCEYQVKYNMAIRDLGRKHKNKKITREEKTEIQKLKDRNKELISKLNDIKSMLRGRI